MRLLERLVAGAAAAVRASAVGLFAIVALSTTGARTAAAQVPPQQRDQILADIARACAREAASYIRRIEVTRMLDRAQALDWVLQRWSEHLDLAELRALRDLRQDAMWKLGGGDRASWPENAEALADLCFATRRIDQLGGQVQLPVPTGVVRLLAPAYNTVTRPGDGRDERLLACLNVRQVGPLDVQITNACSQPVIALWCLAETTCPVEMQRVLLKPGQGNFVRGIRDGAVNTLHVSACPEGRAGRYSWPGFVVSCEAR